MATFPKPTPTADAEQAIRALAEEFVKHYEKRDLEKLVALYTTDGHMMAPFEPMAVGTNALRQHFQQLFTEYDPHDLRVQTTHVEVGEDIAVGFGTFTLNMRMPNGKRVDDHGKWITTMRHTGKTWRIVGHCYNTDLPMTTFTT